MSVVVDIKRVLFVVVSSLVSSWDIVVSSVSSLAVVVSLVSSHMFPLHCHLPPVVVVISVVVEVVVVVVLVEVEDVFGLGLILKEVGLVLFFLVDVTPGNIFLNVIIKLYFHSLLVHEGIILTKLPFDDFLHFDSKYPVVETEYSGSDLSAFNLYL